MRNQIPGAAPHLPHIVNNLYSFISRLMFRFVCFVFYCIQDTVEEHGFTTICVCTMYICGYHLIGSIQMSHCEIICTVRYDLRYPEKIYFKKNNNFQQFMTVFWCNLYLIREYTFLVTKWAFFWRSLNTYIPTHRVISHVAVVAGWN